MEKGCHIKDPNAKVQAMVWMLKGVHNLYIHLNIKKYPHLKNINV